MADISFVRKTWTDQIINRLDRTVTHTPVTQTKHPITGDESFTEGTPKSILAAFLRRDQRWTFDEAGEIEGGDAYVMVKPAIATINKNDLITVDGTVYRARDVITRYGDSNNSTALFHYANLFVERRT